MAPSGRGDLLILSAPSGSGKTTLAYALVEALEGVVFSRSTTTRPPRPDEVDGRDYDFVDSETFDSMVREGRFLEWAQVLSHRYGTPDSFVEQEVRAGRDVVLNIDIQGALNVKEKRSDAVLIFILPPSFEELRRRLVARSRQTRATDVRHRLETGLQEVRAMEEFDYVVVNDVVEEALETLCSIVRARRARRERMGERVRPILDTFDQARSEGFEVE